MATTTPAPGRKLLIGGRAIVTSIGAKPDKKTVRWLYGQLPDLPVIWRLAEDGARYAWEDELTAYLETKAAEAKAAKIVAAEAKAAEKEAMAAAATKIAQSAPRPKIRKPALTPARKGARPQRRERLSEAVD